MMQMRRHGIEGITAARLKRMQAIRRKLRRVKLNLNQLQDLGGCRVILPSINDVRRLTATFKETTRHEFRGKDDDYIENPKPDGYRSHHLKLVYRAKDGAEMHDGRRIEVQIRTRLQHSWATAVEAVGLFRGEDLKANRGSEEWLRLFRLMSAEFAETERCPVRDEMPGASERRREIRGLNLALGALETLDGISHAVNWTELYVTSSSRNWPTHYLISFDTQAKTVDVKPYTQASYAVQGYDHAEDRDNQADSEDTNVVLVEVDKLENLKEAYPNYFGDVQLFWAQLKALSLGKAAFEYTVPPQATVASRPRENPDLAWLRRRTYRWS